MKRIKLCDRALPDYTFGEELLNSISHGAGIALGIVVCILCSVKTVNNGYPFAGALIYGLSMIILYSFSTIYHSLRPGIPKKVFQILDHCTIYILIAGTYTPILLSVFVPVMPVLGWGLLLMQWSISVVAIVLNAIDLHRYRYFSYATYLILGWAIAIVAPYALKMIAPSALWYLLMGGISYTAGAVAFFIGIKRRWYHGIFHILVIIGSFLQFIGIYLYIL